MFIVLCFLCTKVDIEPNDLCLSQDSVVQICGRICVPYICICMYMPVNTCVCIWAFICIARALLLSPISLWLKPLQLKIEADPWPKRIIEIRPAAHLHANDLQLPGKHFRKVLLISYFTFVLFFTFFSFLFFLFSFFFFSASGQH